MKLDLIKQTNDLCEAIGGVILNHIPIAILIAAVSYDVSKSIPSKPSKQPVEPVEPLVSLSPRITSGSEQEELIRLIEAIFGSYGLPKGIGSTIAMYESKLNPKAVSKTGCRGLFQFCKNTARTYGLEDREDPIASTIAAAELMLDNARKLKKKGIELTNVNLYLSHMIGSKGITLLYHKLKGRNLNRRDRRTLRKVLKPNWVPSMGHLYYRVSTVNAMRFYSHIETHFNKIYREVNHNYNV